MNKLKSGFTLIEILIVIAIIGVLSVSLVPNIAGAPAKARDLSKKQAVMQADAALQAYMVSKGRAPDLKQGINQFGQISMCLNETSDGNKDLVFGGEIPKATSGAALNADECIEADGTIYPRYIVAADGKYRFEILVESTASSNHTVAGQDAIPPVNGVGGQDAVAARNTYWTGTYAPQ
jgi:prepilin-type N-terminal cleavage/methylation domain-containing protein